MKKMNIVFVLSALCLSFSLSAQTVDQIIDKEIDAMGGRDKIGQLTSEYMETNVQMMGNDAPAKTTVLYGKGFKMVMDFNGSQMVFCYTDKGGWIINPMMGSAPQAMPEEQFKTGKLQLDGGGPLFNYKEKGYQVELVGQEKVGDVNAYKIKLTTNDSIEITYYIDPSTFYIIQTVIPGDFQGQPIDITTTYSDYRKTDFGITVPWSIETSYGGQFSMPITVTKFEVNKPVDPAIFEMPKQ